VTAGTKVIGYVRVSTEEQGESGLGLESQRQAIRRACEERGWTLTAIEEDVQSAKSRRKRPGLDAAIAACRSGDATGIVAAKLDRLTRSVVDCGALLELADRGRGNLVALDFGLDLSTPQGRLVANVLASVAQWEREVIGERIRAALKVKRERGEPGQVPPDVRKRILQLHRRGLSERRIAETLNRRKVPALGRCWHRTTVSRILQQES
jgi:DNA invertase Pin-like site-specific DNA recombinase